MDVSLLFAVLLLSYFNGANDNFKGVATLLGSGTSRYRPLLILATCATLAGSTASAYVATGLVDQFTGAGLLPGGAATGGVPAAAAIGAVATLSMATLLGMPVSTTHALTGGLAGAALNSAGHRIEMSALLNTFILPLLASPLLAMAATAVAYLFLRYVRIRAGVDKETCICLGTTVVQTIPIRAVNESLLVPASVALSVAPEQVCFECYRGRLFGISLQALLDSLHYLSAAAVSFARGLNDTPKIVAVLAASSLLGVNQSHLLVGLLMALGALLQAGRVAQTVSYRITGINHGQGFTANLITSLLVIFASRWGLPVSTTHVSCGSLFGIGLTTGQAQYKTVSTILLAWLFTLPLSALTGFLAAGYLLR